jgi:hypothetical protein
MNNFKTIIWVLLLQFMILNANGQDSKTNSKWSASLSFTPAYAYRIVTVPKKNYNTFPNYLSYVTNDQIPKFGFQIGASVNYQIKSYLSVQSGILLNNNGYNTNTVQDSSNFLGIPSTPVMNIKFHCNNTYLGLPIMVYGQIKCTERLYVNCGLGFTVNFIMWGTLHTDGYGGWGTSSFSEFETLNMSLIAKVGVNYKFSDRLSLIISPVFNYMLLPAYDSYARDGASKNLNFYTVGLELGLSYHFKQKK